MLFKVEDFDGLGSIPFIEKMMAEVCREDCTTIVDLCFLMDASGSIDRFVTTLSTSVVKTTLV